MSIQRSGSLLDDVRRVVRLNHYSIHTERTYSDWIRQYVKFHKMTDRSDLSVLPEAKVEAFLTENQWVCGRARSIIPAGESPTLIKELKGELKN